jgi:hypothetical protein
MPAAKEQKYHQNGGMFFLVEGKYIKEYEPMNTSELYDLFVKIMNSATSISMLSEFSLYGFVIKVNIDPHGPIKIMRQTRSVTGEPVTPKRASKRECPEQLTSFCLKIVGVGTGSRQYVSLDSTKTKKKSLATFKECKDEINTTRSVWHEMARHNCAEVVPDAGFGVDIDDTEFEELFKRFITTPHDVSSHVIQWIINNFEAVYLTVMEMASGCDTLSAYIDRMERPTTQSIAQESIKNASIEIVSYLIAMWIRTGIMTTDGHSKNVMVRETGADIDSGIHVFFIIYLLDLGRIFNRKAGRDRDIVIKKHLLTIFTINTPPRIALRPALLSYLKWTDPFPGLAALDRDAALNELASKMSIEFQSVDSLNLLSLTPTELNIDQLKKAFISAIVCDIVVNASVYNHNYPQCVTLLARVFGIEFTNVSFLEHPFASLDDDAVFDMMLFVVNRLLLPCHPGEVSLSFRTPPATPRIPPIPPATPSAFDHPTDNVGDFVGINVGGVNVPALVVPDDSESSLAPAAAVKRSSSSSSLTPGQKAYFAADVGGSRKKRRHKIRRVIKRSHSRSKHLRRYRNEKCSIHTTRRKYRRN